MKLALLLPGLVPDLRWFLAVQEADMVVLNDISPWSRKSRVHRYQIRTPQGTQWLNVPVAKIDQQPLRDAQIDTSTNWSADHLRTLQMNYRNSLFFDFLEAEIEAVMQQASMCKSIVEASTITTQLWFRLLEMDPILHYASKLDAWSHDPDQLALNLGATKLILEHESRHFQRQPVSTPTMVMPHPEYRQHFGGFYSGCGILDYIFSKGPYNLGLTN